MQLAVLDGNQAAAEVAYACNEVVAIYPITPASSMGELSDQWSADARPNLWGEVPRVVEMQSEAGAAGTVHGALQAGSLTTTFTASQGLLLMLPNMFKIAGELTSCVFHIAARTIATHALSIFGDHSDVMAARSTGWAMLFGTSVQEAHDLALISQVATLETRVPFLHILDGFRTSHEEARVALLSHEDMLALLPHPAIERHRGRGLHPEHPQLRGTAQNPDVYFQAREASNPYYQKVPGAVRQAMLRFHQQTGRKYDIVEYYGDPQAARVVVAMGSACQTLGETVDALRARGEAVGAVFIRLFRPFDGEALLQALPHSCRRLAVLDRCHEAGAVAEPLYQDVVTVLAEAGRSMCTCGGRYGLASKEFTPAMAAAVYAELSQAEPRRRFTVGIHDDVGGLSLDYDGHWILEDPQSVRAVFWGLGSDGTVGANKNSIRIIGEATDMFVQGYFVYDSKKSGAKTVSHLRFGPRPVSRPYLIQKASFVGIHQFEFVERYDTLGVAEEGAVVLLNSPFGADEVWARLPARFQAQVVNKSLKLWVVDAQKLARELGLGGRINTIMQTCFFYLSQVVPQQRSLELIKQAVQKSYSKAGEVVVRRNFAAVDGAIEGLAEVRPGEVAEVPEEVPPQGLIASLLADQGELLPVSAFSADGTFETDTARLEKRNISDLVPEWREDLCIQCGKCVFVCPHSAIRAKLVEADSLTQAPPGFTTLPSAFKELPEHRYTLQVSEMDCTGCKLCVEACPAWDKKVEGRRALDMVLRAPGAKDSHAWDFFLQLPEEAPAEFRWSSVKNLQLRQPYFEFSGACAGCGETPYLRVLSQLYGDHLLIANATGCSSIYGGNLPTTPWSKDHQGRGPAWSNSLFEDNAEFGLGMRLALDQQQTYARQLVEQRREQLGDSLCQQLLDPELPRPQRRLAVQQLRQQLGSSPVPADQDLVALADCLIDPSTWLIGGDGWAYDIGFGGLDHVLASNARVRVLVLDTEVYSNTGGQSSKSTPLGAVAKFSAGGKLTPKKDLGLMAIDSGNCYVASVAMGANQAQTIKAMQEAEDFPGPALIIAYCHCIAHGIDMTLGMTYQQLAVETGAWLLYRYDPRTGLQMDCKAPKRPISEYLGREGRFRVLQGMHPEEAEDFARRSQAAVADRWRKYEIRMQSMSERGST
ncbi:MAG: pyruvate:ferredoxin (flavodoxin) oxidoreductase [Vulcanimicrobiota bacterium]